MKNRDYKTFRPNNYYHIFNRGVDKKEIFLDEDDYLNFLKRLKIILGLAKNTNLNIKPLPINSFSILSFCLMPNHFHFLIRQNSEIGIQNLMLKLCTSYGMYFNKKHGRIGPLFQDTFKAKLVETDSYAMYLSAYIHNNPQNLLTYPYSSFLDIICERQGLIADKNTLLGWFGNSPKKYKDFVLKFKTGDKKTIQHILFEE